MIIALVIRQISIAGAAHPVRAGPRIVFGIPKLTSDQRESELRVALLEMGIDVVMYRVEKPEELNPPAGKIGIFIGEDISIDSIKNGTSLKTIELIAKYRIILTMNKIDPSIRGRIAEIIKDLLGKDILSKNAAEIFARAQAKVKENPAGLTGKLKELKGLVLRQSAQLAQMTNYSEPSLVPGTITDKKAAIVTTERVAVNDPTLARDLKRSESLDVVNVFIYGEIFKTEDQVKESLRASGYEGDLDAIVYVNGTGLSYEKIMDQVDAATRRYKVVDRGIRIAKGEFKNIDTWQGKVLEVQDATINGKNVLLTMNTYEALLNIVKSNGTEDEIAAALEVRLPGIAYDATRKIFTYLPKTLPINYGEEIETYRAAILVLSAAA